MIHPINESEKSRIRDLHLNNFVLKEEREKWRNKIWKDGKELYGPPDFNLNNHNPPGVLHLEPDVWNHTINFNEGTPENTTRIDIENFSDFVTGTNVRRILSTENLSELSNFPNVDVLSINGGILESLPPEALSPNLMFLSVNDVRLLNPLPIEKILTLDNLNTLNLRGTTPELTPEDKEIIKNKGITLI